MKRIHFFTTFFVIIGQLAIAGSDYVEVFMQGIGLSTNTENQCVGLWQTPAAITNEGAVYHCQNFEHFSFDCEHEVFSFSLFSGNQKVALADVHVLTNHVDALLEACFQICNTSSPSHLYFSRYSVSTNNNVVCIQEKFSANTPQGFVLGTNLVYCIKWNIALEIESEQDAAVLGTLLLNAGVKEEQDEAPPN